MLIWAKYDVIRIYGVFSVCLVWCFRWCGVVGVYMAFLRCVLGVGGMLLGCAGLRRVLACFRVLWVVLVWWYVFGCGCWCVGWCNIMQM